MLPTTWSTALAPASVTIWRSASASTPYGFELRSPLTLSRLRFHSISEMLATGVRPLVRSNRRPACLRAHAGAPRMSFGVPEVSTPNTFPSGATETPCTPVANTPPAPDVESKPLMKVVFLPLATLTMLLVMPMQNLFSPLPWQSLPPLPAFAT